MQLVLRSCWAYEEVAQAGEMVTPAIDEDLLLLEQPWPPLLARALPTWCRDMQPQSESSSPGRAGVIRTMPCKRSHHYLGHARGSARCRRARCLLPGWSGCRGNWAPVTIWGMGEGPWAAVRTSTEGLHCSCHKRRSAGESSTTSTDTGTGALKSHLGIYIPPCREGGSHPEGASLLPHLRALTHLCPSPVTTPNKR